LDLYREKYLEGKPEIFGNKAALEEGSLAHSMLLEPELVDNEYVFWSGWRKAGKEWETFLAELSPADAKKTIISTPQKYRVDKLAKACRAHKVGSSLLTGGESELTVCGTIMDVPIKTRFDYINVEKGYIADIKTTGYSGELDSFKQTLKDLSYQLSGALYCMIAEQYFGKKFDFYYIVLSKRDEDCQVYKTSEETMNQGRRMVLDALLKYKKALSTNVWTEETQNDTVINETDYEILEV
jgi:hypothetical protein